jgi:hypothetical protein
MLKRRITEPGDGSGPVAGRLRLDPFVRIAVRADAHELLRGVELAAGTASISMRHRFAFE